MFLRILSVIPLVGLLGLPGMAQGPEFHEVCDPIRGTCDATQSAATAEDCTQPGTACTLTIRGRTYAGRCRDTQLRVYHCCMCFPNIPPNGGNNQVRSTFRASAPIALPAPGQSIMVSFSVDEPSSSVVTTLGSLWGDASFIVPVVSATLDFQATRRSSPGQEHLFDVELMGDLMIGESVSLPGISPSGRNILQHDTLRGMFNLHGGQVMLQGTGTIVNDWVSPANPIRVDTFQAGTLDLSTGIAEIITIAVDHFPTGSVMVLGQGCPGSGGLTPVISTVNGLPSVGNQQFGIEVTEALGGTDALLFVGVSSSVWNGLPLPLDLTSYGLPGCLLEISLDAILSVPTSGAGPGMGTAAVPLPIPNTPGLGGSIHCQWYVVDPGPTPIPGSMSPALRLTIQ